MLWILWLQLTSTMVCAPGIPCQAPMVQKQALTQTYQSEAACQKAGRHIQTAYSRASELQGQRGTKVITTAKLWCASEQRKGR